MKIFSTVALSLVGLCLVSCQKETGGSAQTKVNLISSGPWVHESSGIDTDRNGSIDYTLAFAGVPVCRLDNTLTFKKDGTATADEGATKCDPSDATTTNFKWSFADNETNLVISDNVFSALNGKLKIKTLSSTNLTLTKDTTITTPFTASVTIIVNLKH
jgi:hypothetical protein